VDDNGSASDGSASDGLADGLASDGLASDGSANDDSANLPIQTTPHPTTGGKRLPPFGIGQGLPGYRVRAEAVPSTTSDPHTTSNLLEEMTMLQKKLEIVNGRHEYAVECFRQKQSENNSLQDDMNSLQDENKGLKKKLKNADAQRKHQKKVISEFKDYCKNLRTQMRELRAAAGQPPGEEEIDPLAGLRKGKSEMIEKDEFFGLVRVKALSWMPKEMRKWLDESTSQECLDLTTFKKTKECTKGLVEIFKKWMKTKGPVQWSVTQDGKVYTVEFALPASCIIDDMEHQSPKVDIARLPEGGPTDFLKFVCLLRQGEVTVDRKENGTYCMSFKLEPTLSETTKRPAHCFEGTHTRANGETSAIFYFFKFEKGNPFTAGSNLIPFGLGTHFETMGKAVFQKYLYTLTMKKLAADDRFDFMHTF